MKISLKYLKNINVNLIEIVRRFKEKDKKLKIQLELRINFEY